MNMFKDHTTSKAPLGEIQAAQLIACLATELYAAGEILQAMRHFGSQAQMTHTNSRLEQRELIDGQLLRAREREAVLNMVKQYQASGFTTPLRSQATRDLVRRLRTVAGQSTVKPPALDLEAADHIEQLERRIAELERHEHRGAK